MLLASITTTAKSIDQLLSPAQLAVLLSVKEKEFQGLIQNLDSSIDIYADNDSLTDATKGVKIRAVDGALSFSSKTMSSIFLYAASANSNVRLVIS